jgi:hypothetical protein
MSYRLSFVVAFPSNAGLSIAGELAEQRRSVGKRA